MDGKYEPGTPGKDAAAAKTKYTPRSPEELQKIEALVKGAIGFNQERGDQISIQNIPFQDGADAAGSAESARWYTNPFVMTLSKNLLIAGAFLLLLLFVIRPMINTLRTARPPRPDLLESFSVESPEKLSASERAQIAMQMAEQQDLMEKAKTNPYQVAQILQNWLGEES